MLRSINCNHSNQNMYWRTFHSAERLNLDLYKILWVCVRMLKLTLSWIFFISIQVRESVQNKRSNMNSLMKLEVLIQNCKILVHPKLIWLIFQTVSSQIKKDRKLNWELKTIEPISKSYKNLQIDQPIEAFLWTDLEDCWDKPMRLWATTIMKAKRKVI